MSKVYYHNEKSIDQNINTKKLSEAQHISKKQVVDINKLLNRVKINQRKEAIKKITFYSLTIFSLSLALILIINIK
tara:strand:- start:400 stop:627 length:228 start_codon:yes stop_codon:yes gene_type:complete